MHTLARLCIKLDMYCGKATIYLTRLEAGKFFTNNVESDKVRTMDQRRPHIELKVHRVESDTSSPPHIVLVAAQ